MVHKTLTYPWRGEGGSGEGEGRGRGGGGEAISVSAFWRIGMNEFLVDNIKLVQP